MDSQENTISVLPSNYTQLGEIKPDLRLNISTFIPHHDPVLLHSHVCSKMDFSKLHATYSNLGDKPDIPPHLMFSLICFAYQLGIFSSRKIEAACLNDRRFMWLLGSRKAPDHSTISRFRSGHLIEGVMEDLLVQQVKILHELGEVRFDDMFIDGTKFEANANPYSFVWLRAVKGNKLKMYEKIKAYLPILEQRYELSYEFEAHNGMELLLNLRKVLHEKAVSGSIALVSGRGRRKSQLQRDLEKVQEWIKRDQDYLKKEETSKGRNSYSKTDPDATFMVMNKDHMRNEQLRAGYNVQAGVEGEYILSIKVFQTTTDNRTLIPFLDDFNAKYRFKPDLCLDAGYESEEIYDYLEKEEYYSYIKPANYEQSKKRKYRANIGRRENMDYNPKKDEYTCAQGRKLSVITEKNEKTKTDYVRKVTIYESKTCNRCPIRKDCTKAKAGNKKRLQVSKKFVAYREESLARIKSSRGIKMRINRSIQAEGVFGWIKANYGFKRFLLRGRSKVSVEIQLLAFALNIKKLHNKIQSGRTGKTLHEVKAS
jgi:transposase